MRLNYNKLRSLKTFVHTQIVSFLQHSSFFASFIAALCQTSCRVSLLPYSPTSPPPFSSSVLGSKVCSPRILLYNKARASQPQGAISSVFFFSPLGSISLSSHSQVIGRQRKRGERRPKKKRDRRKEAEE